MTTFDYNERVKRFRSLIPLLLSLVFLTTFLYIVAKPLHETGHYLAAVASGCGATMYWGMTITTCASFAIKVFGGVFAATILLCLALPSQPRFRGPFVSVAMGELVYAPLDGTFLGGILYVTVMAVVFGFFAYRETTRILDLNIVRETFI